MNDGKYKRRPMSKKSLLEVAEEEEVGVPSDNTDSFGTNRESRTIFLVNLFLVFL